MSAVLAVNIGYSPRHAVLPPGSQPPRRGPRRIVVILSVLALFSAGSAYGVLRAVRLAAGSPSAAAIGHGVHIYPATRLGLRGPASLTGAGQYLWITNSAGNSVTELDVRTGRHRVIGTGPEYGFLAPGAITAGHGHVWVADVVADRITELRAADGAVIRTITDAASPHSLVLFGNRLWTANPAANSIYLIDARTGSKVRAFRYDGLKYPSALAVSHRLLWVANEAKDTITVLSASTGAWKSTLRGPRYGLGQPVSELASQTMLWVANASAGTITQISTVTGKPVRIIGGRGYRLGVPGAMALANGKLWVLNTIGNSVTEIDVRSGRPVAVLSGSSYGFDNPVGIAAFGHAIWVASATSLTRIALRQ